MPICRECHEPSGYHAGNCPNTPDVVCEHEPDLKSLSMPKDIHQEPEIIGEEIDIVLDVTCKHCGCSGSFRASALLENINW